MKSILGTAIGIALSFIISCGALAIGFYHLEIARAQEALATFDLSRADRIYARLEKTLEIGKSIPWIFTSASEDLRVRRVRLAYWRQDYAAVLDATSTTGEDEGALSPPMRFLRANARCRAVAGTQGREQMIKEFNLAIRDYAKVLDADPGFMESAFNYEYLLMIRDDIAGGRRRSPFRPSGAMESKLDQRNGVHGEQGVEPAVKVPQKMKVWVPKEDGEDPRKLGPEPGKGSATKKRG